MGDGIAIDRFPGGEVLAAGGEDADFGGAAIGDDEHLVRNEEAGDFGLVGLELVVGGLDGGLLVGHVLELDDGEGETVDEEDDIGAALVLAVDGELVDGEEVVVGGVIEIDEADALAANLPAAKHLDGDTLDQEPVKFAVGVDGRRRADVGDAVDGLRSGLRGGVGIETGDGLGEPLAKDDLAVVVSLGGGRFWGDVRTVENGVAKLGEPLQGGFFDDGFREADASHQKALWTRYSSAFGSDWDVSAKYKSGGSRSSPESRRGRRVSRSLASVRFCNSFSPILASSGLATRSNI